MKEFYSIDDVSGFSGLSADTQRKLRKEYNIETDVVGDRGRPTIVYSRNAFIKIMQAAGWSLRNNEWIKIKKTRDK